MKFKFLLLILTVIWLLVIGKLYQNQALSFHFVDEEDNLVLGQYLLKGEKLYSNLFSQHQPLAYIFSAGIQTTTNPNSLFLLLKRHREAMIIWSFVWTVFLVARFGFPFFLFSLIYEPMKIFLLGNLFLSESLIIYPLIFIVSVLILSSKKLKIWENILLGLSFILSLFLLSPLWPLLVILLVRYLIKTKKNLKMIFFLFIGALPIFILTLNFISIPEYIFNTFYINLKYYIPITTHDPVWISAFKSIISPFTVLTSWQGSSATLQVMQILSLLLILGSFILFKNNQWKTVLYIYLILALANIRYIIPGQQMYSGFHLLPWFTLLTFFAAFIITLTWQKSARIVRSMYIVLAFFLVGIMAKETGNILFIKKDMNKDAYINYSRQFDFGQAVKIMKSGSDNLFVVPDDWLIYWQADIPHAFWMVNYYAWMSQVPEIKIPLEDQFNQRPPTFFYCDKCQNGYFGLEQFFNLYQPIKKDGQITNLLVLQEKISKLDQQQKKDLSFYNFSF